MEDEIDYVVEALTKSDLQKKLNQWRHDYHLEIESMAYAKDGIMMVIIKRKRRFKG